MDSEFKRRIQDIPLLQNKSGPRDAGWEERLKEELLTLIGYVETLKENDNDWFEIECSDDGKEWHGECWFMHNLTKYRFKVEFEIPATYPSAPMEIILPELDGKTPKMYRGGKICMDIHFAPLWRDNAPKFGIAHAMCLALGPWLAAEVPVLVEDGKIAEK